VKQPEVTDLHRQSASGFLCWPMNMIDLAKRDQDLPQLVDELAKFIARWEAMGANKAAVHKLIDARRAELRAMPINGGG
jgi:hypothetical protein